MENKSVYPREVFCFIFILFNFTILSQYVGTWIYFVNVWQNCVFLDNSCCFFVCFCCCWYLLVKHFLPWYLFSSNCSCFSCLLVRLSSLCICWLIFLCHGSTTLGTDVYYCVLLEYSKEGVKKRIVKESIFCTIWEGGFCQGLFFFPFDKMRSFWTPSQKVFNK